MVWRAGLLLPLVLPLWCAPAATVEESYVPPTEVIIETNDYSEPTIVRGEQILEPVPPPTYTYENIYVPSVQVAVRSLSPQEIREFKVPGGMQFPLPIPGWISSVFGYRIHPITGEERFHQGTDIAAPAGTPVLAAWEGTVEIAGWLGGLGFAVVIAHDNGNRETRYGHLSHILVEPGQTVSQGQPIGLVGSTGLSTGPHLHFELWEKEGEQWVVKDPTPALIAALARLETYLARKS
ncbi:MAG: M23 family metallopeptidase [Pseudanabaenaceae cyanobacterium SKYGB_i_bin29]|nr:M23 family metallopeptidase [Pseudanabaenaceae cyanobacterium SKYG29]MDW8420377.1 M23 family metallopeptidase [Pseudanabaenaceae cyanobacterium SKYGB_i_bin29]